MRLITGEEFQAFVSAKPTAAVHFDAEWDRLRDLTRRRMMEAKQALGEQVNFGEVDTDRELELAKAIPVENVPLVAYYRDGVLVAALVGTGQNVLGRLQRVIQGLPIGRNDGLGW